MRSSLGEKRSTPRSPLKECGNQGVLVYTATSSRLQGAELEYIINDCGAHAYITSKYKAAEGATCETVDVSRTDSSA
jgi:hypothetical protein